MRDCLDCIWALKDEDVSETKDLRARRAKISNLQSGLRLRERERLTVHKFLTCFCDSANGCILRFGDLSR